MRRALPRTAEAAAEGGSAFQNIVSNAEKLSERFIAGILLLDIISYSWERY